MLSLTVIFLLLISIVLPAHADICVIQKTVTNTAAPRLSMKENTPTRLELSDFRPHRLEYITFGRGLRGYCRFTVQLENTETGESVVAWKSARYSIGPEAYEGEEHTVLFDGVEYKIMLQTCASRGEQSEIAVRQTFDLGPGKACTLDEFGAFGGLLEVTPIGEIQRAIVRTLSVKAWYSEYTHKEITRSAGTVDFSAMRGQELQTSKGTTIGRSQVTVAVQNSIEKNFAVTISQERSSESQITIRPGLCPDWKIDVVEHRQFFEVRNPADASRSMVVPGLIAVTLEPRPDPAVCN